MAPSRGAAQCDKKKKNSNLVSKQSCVHAWERERPHRGLGETKQARLIRKQTQAKGLKGYRQDAVGCPIIDGRRGRGRKFGRPPGHLVSQHRRVVPWKKSWPLSGKRRNRFHSTTSEIQSMKPSASGCRRWPPCTAVGYGLEADSLLSVCFVCFLAMVVSRAKRERCPR